MQCPFCFTKIAFKTVVHLFLAEIWQYSDTRILQFAILGDIRAVARHFLDGIGRAFDEGIRIAVAHYI
jgi:hypothetical protein